MLNNRLPNRPQMKQKCNSELRVRGFGQARDIGGSTMRCLSAKMAGQKHQRNVQIVAAIINIERANP